MQQLLTHKSPVMTQRYAHLRDEALKKASGVAGDIITEAAKAAAKKARVEAEKAKNKSAVTAGKK